MAINEITGHGAVPHSSKKKNATRTSEHSAPMSDRVELSSEAKTLIETGFQKRMEEIQQKIHDRFYFRSEVTEKVATAIIHDISK